MLVALGQGSHALAALLFGLLAGWQLVRGERRRAMAVLTLAFALTALWAGLAAALGPEAILARAGESARNLGYLAFIFMLLRGGLGAETRPFVTLLHLALLIVGLSQIGFDLVFGLLLEGQGLVAGAYGATTMLHVIFAIGGLFLLHALYAAAAPETRWGIRLTVIALAAMWTYDLNLYTFGWLGGRVPVELLALRGVLMLGLVPSFALAMRRNALWKMKLSRKVTFRSLSLLAIGAYFLVMFVVSQAIALFADDHAAAIQAVFVFLMSAGAILLLPSTRVRGWLRVKLTKHLFEHRYDYRTEWIRFNSTLARPGDDAAPLDERVVRAIADITESPGGLLLIPEGEGELVAAARWNWPTLEAPRRAGAAELGHWLEASGHIVELEPLRSGNKGAGERAATLIPDWILAAAHAWALVPLIHRNRLAGAVLLERPRIDRTLDWEDLDLLRIAGRQAASYLAEARGQEDLAEARRFDEFNRRFAFIMHDIKNLVSQLSLVARNAERHADNPAFRADMIATLQDSVGKMNDLLARLAPKQRIRGEAPRPIGLRPVAKAIGAQKSAAHPIEIAAGEDCFALADPARLETALAHLVQNAIDASPTGDPVRLTIARDRGEARLAIADRGEGMSEAFIRDHLFRPFNSSKTGGFGIGAFEARALIGAMGGRLEVESRVGEGSIFTIILPVAQAADGEPGVEGMVA